ncbi:hypothetical protein B0H16DRAFT_1696121 [Mycena metata]|uniref:Zn(2)-C6 fungal-type domain-containing protein n=1 Tax=Mycena metata TaxID=1033252 RepID=A0AAD7I4H8_9AGAR|nr:hypothetical protein B0H16DRAFT_1696121 [Mycena metata]
MATSDSTDSSHIQLVKKRRSLMACTRCRQRKVRCIPADQLPKNPCARCIKRHVSCEYVAVASDPSGSPSEASTSADISSPTPDLPTSTMADRHRTRLPRSQPRERAPPLPYTRAPPLNQRRLMNLTRHLPAAFNFLPEGHSHGPRTNPTRASSGDPFIQLPHPQSPPTPPAPDIYSLEIAHCAHQYLTNRTVAQEALVNAISYTDHLEPPLFEQKLMQPQQGWSAYSNTRWGPIYW